MKKISICFLTLLLLFVTGCKNNQQEINCVLNNNTKYQIFCYAYFGILLFHQIYNIAMNLGLVPIMGIPLSFLEFNSC